MLWRLTMRHLPLLHASRVGHALLSCPLLLRTVRQGVLQRGRDPCLLLVRQEAGGRCLLLRYGSQESGLLGLKGSCDACYLLLLLKRGRASCRSMLPRSMPRCWLSERRLMRLVAPRRVLARVLRVGHRCCSEAGAGTVPR